MYWPQWLIFVPVLVIGTWGSFALQSQNWVLGNPHGVFLQGAGLYTAFPWAAGLINDAGVTLLLMSLVGFGWLGMVVYQIIRHSGRAGRMDRDDRQATIRALFSGWCALCLAGVVLATLAFATARYAATPEALLIKESLFAPTRVYHWDQVRGLTARCWIHVIARSRYHYDQLTLKMVDGRLVNLAPTLKFDDWAAMNPGYPLLFAQLRRDPITTSIEDQGCVSPPLPAFLPRPSAPMRGATD